VRATELAMGLRMQSMKLARPLPVESTFQESMKSVVSSGNFNFEVSLALKEALRIIIKLEFVPDVTFNKILLQQDLLYTNFMDINWQYGNPSNPADAAIGPQIYDNHLYYSFGGVADPNETAYLQHICNLDRIEADAALGNTPLFFGEWALSTQFSPSDSFLRKWADAQKMAYSKGAGWIFWNFKMEKTSSENRQWSYFEGLERGYFTWDPSDYNDPDVCKPYRD
jgi:hypothetical protein